MAWRGDELDAESGEVEDDRAEDIHVGFAGIAAAGADLPQRSDLRNNRSRSGSSCRARRKAPAPSKTRSSTVPRRHAIFRREPDSACRGRRARRPRRRCSCRDRVRYAPSRLCDGAHRAGLTQALQSLPHFDWFDLRQPSEPVGQGGGSLRVFHRPMALSDPCFQYVIHGQLSPSTDRIRNRRD